MAKIHQPHDKIFKAAFKTKEVVVDFLQANLSLHVLEKLDLSSIRLTDTSFISAKLKSRHSDVVYRLKLKDGLGDAYLLFEQQTAQDKLLPVRILEYNTQLIRQHINTHQGGKLPVFINLVIYTGSKEYTGDVRLLDAICSPSLHYATFEERLVIELHKKPIEKIKAEGKATLAQYVLIAGVQKDLLAWLKDHREMAGYINTSPYGAEAFEYILDRCPYSEQELLEALEINEQTKSTIMSRLKAIREEGKEEGIVFGIRKGMQAGIEEGIQKGMEKGRLDTAKRMLAKGIDRATIKDITGITEEELKQIEEEEKRARQSS